MKILKFIFIFILIIGIDTQSHAQTLDCPGTLKLRRAMPPYKLNDLSKSAACYTGRKYDFLVPLTKGKDYRLSFYASPVFNNNIHFIIIDQNTGERVLDLPGVSETGTPGTSVLQNFYDDGAQKTVHPFFDFHPATSTTLKIIIDVKSSEEGIADAGEGFSPPEIRQKGCITVFIQDKKGVIEGFEY